MTNIEIQNLIARLYLENARAGEDGNATFEDWYESANFYDIRDHCKVGWLIGRYLNSL